MGIISSYEGHKKDNKNAIQARQTEVGTVAVRIEMPAEADQFIIWHIDDGVTVWIGDNKDITVDGIDVAPLKPDTMLSFVLEKGNDNQVYAIVSSGTTTLYTIGAVAS